jgi:Zinc-finger associated domain (zf-AD)
MKSNTKLPLPLFCVSEGAFMSKIYVSRQVDQLTAKLYKSCRLCLCEEATQISLFANIVENVPYFEIANKFTDVAIEREDKLPTRICGQCSGKLAMFHEFKLKCEKSRSYLESIYNLLYKVSPGEHAKQEEMIGKEEQKDSIQENFEIVEVLEEEDDDDGETVEEEEDEEAMEEVQMPNIEEEFGFDQENNSYNVHLTEEGDLSFTPLPTETILPGDGSRALRRGYGPASTSMRRDTLVTTLQNQTKIEEHFSYVAEAGDKKEQSPRKSYSQKILLQTRPKKEHASTSADTDHVTKRKAAVKKIVVLPSADTPAPIKKSPPKTSVKHEVGVEKKFKNHCDLCGASYKLKSDFKQHIVEMHGMQDKIQCTLCGKVFVREVNSEIRRLDHRFD